MALSLLFKKKKADANENGPMTVQEDRKSTQRSTMGPSGFGSSETGSTHSSGSSQLDSLLGTVNDGTSTFGEELPHPAYRSDGRTQTFLLGILILALVALVGAGWWVISRSHLTFGESQDVSVALLQSQRLAKANSLSMMWREEAFTELGQSANILNAKLRALQSDPNIASRTGPLAGRIEKNTTAVLAAQKQLIDAGHALRAINLLSNDMRTATEQFATLKTQEGTSITEMNAIGRLMTLTQRIGRSSLELLATPDFSPKAITDFGQVFTDFQTSSQALLDGKAGLPGTRVGDTRAKLQSIIALFDKANIAAKSLQANQKVLNDARGAQLALLSDGDQLTQALQDMQGIAPKASSINWTDLGFVFIPLLIALITGVVLFNLQMRRFRLRQSQGDQERMAADQQRQEAKRINEANQAAILRLMNELQAVAEGDLTQEATVTEDITGAIADSVNYTVEELRTLVGNVQGATMRVTETTSKVDKTSTELLAASTEQLREIHATGQSVVDMAGRINQVSTQAQESAEVARQSLKAATLGLTAVQDSIGGMNAIRDQIQETSKRIKRLGESSQEIGEITELIADITEQTNVLALNAAIQAASAGEAGRGFSVVAEEVQRLAERSAGATRQISVLVKAIQTDTQDAIAAMERSTRGVVEGARLSDNAGEALSEIDQVSRRLAQLIEQISSSTVQEAHKANATASSIQHIFAVTEQTSESTRSTASHVRELARIADELRQSVARFKIA